MMKKKTSFFKTSVIVAGLLVTSLFLSSCLKNNSQPTPSAGLMILNLVPDQQSVDVFADNSRLLNVPLQYFTFSGNYLSLYIGNRQLQSYGYGSATPIATTTASLKDSSYYSLFVVGTDGDYKNVFVEDKFSSLPTTTGNAFVRYINAVTGDQESNISISKGSDPLFDDANKLGFVSDFKEVTPGDIDIASVQEGSSPVTRSITVEQNGIYTVLIAGIPGTTDAEKGIQIKFIKNGNLIP